MLFIYLLQSADKYHAYLRKIKQIKNDQLKATLIAAKEKSVKNEEMNIKNSNTNAENKIIRDKKSTVNVKTQNQDNLKVEFAEKNKNNEATNDQEISSCKILFLSIFIIFINLKIFSS